MALGTLTVNPDGSYAFTLPPDGSAGSMIVNMFGADYSSSRTINFSVTDPHGGVFNGSFGVTIKAPTTGPNWNCSAAMITASLSPRVRRPTETRRPTPQSP